MCARFEYRSLRSSPRSLCRGACGRPRRPSSRKPISILVAYGQPICRAAGGRGHSGGGAIGALRAAFAAAASAPAPVVDAAPVAYVEPVPVRYDTAYHLDAGDRLRVVVYGQEGLTNTYAIDAGGSITMPLIGSVPARGRTTAGLAAEISAKLRGGFIREPRSRWRSRLIGRSSFSARSPHPGNIHTCPI